ncbi:hypothetical protein EDB83DRAFT_2440249 [Lactarius deliciosus]|nr:hypothetical protein EDB83DRAFT_2440249 [Lactarius deliciosus]
MTALTVTSAGKSSLLRSFPVTITLEKPVDVAKFADVKAALAARFPRLYVERQKLTLKGDPKALDDDCHSGKLRVCAVETKLVVKDLGPQVSWRTVFLTEYAGPLVIHPLLYHLPNVFYRGQVQHSQLQKSDGVFVGYVYAMAVLHFAKRELETLFVHRFSHATMPLRNIFKNSFHYHVLSGLFLAYPIYGPTYSANSPYIRGTLRASPQFLWSCAAIWLFAELSNLSTHLTLRNLRPPGTRKRAIPHGYGFGLVSMTSWAAKKQRAYKKEFGKDYPRKRKAMFPFIF